MTLTFVPITYQGRAMNRVEESRWPGLESTLYVLCYAFIFSESVVSSKWLMVTID